MANNRFERDAPPASFACCLRAPQAARWAAQVPGNPGGRIFRASSRRKRFGRSSARHPLPAPRPQYQTPHRRPRSGKAVRHRLACRRLRHTGKWSCIRSLGRPFHSFPGVSRPTLWSTRPSLRSVALPPALGITTPPLQT